MPARVEGTAKSEKRAALGYDQRRDGFDERILGCVGRALESVGGLGTQIVFWNLSMTQNLKRDDIVDRPLQFMEGLREILGEKVARTLEAAIVEEVQAEFGLGPREGSEGERFPDVLERANASLNSVSALDLLD